MKIGIDGNEANIKTRVGSNKYAFEVLKALKDINDNQYNICLKDKLLSDMPPPDINWQYKIFGPRPFWTQFALPVKLLTKEWHLDVFFTPGHYAPRFCPCPLVITVLDTSYLNYPQLFLKKDLYQLKNWTSYGIYKAKKIIAISNSTKNDLLKYYRIKDNKVKVIYPGFDRERFSSEIDNQTGRNILKKYNIDNPYVLFVGTIQPRKNLDRLIAVFNREDMPFDLVIVGKKGWMSDEFIEKTKINHKIKIIGYINDEDLPHLYKQALCFILPSLYEGFGFPVIEAMSVGTPVIVSNTSSLPEIVGDAGLMINPTSISDIENSIKSVANFSLSERKSIIEKGYLAVRKYSWEACAREIIETLREASLC